ncbi:AAA ATPase [Pyrolobus fumarii 1A]|uniref:AAA ATPase n=1 Tax=Pyrolobus fumarii (strain DSM 11204 / 1A) TaxID=694429 RepID=G0EGJ2_PYRF1|nr:ATP-binding protein [Pyrolobus fumarii]AEM38366.1 AAA ATPase [Pyrolobus fumarii 1A]
MRIVGREVELRRLEELVEERGSRLVTVLVGPSGIGKSTLASSLRERLDPRAYLVVYLQLLEPVRDVRLLAGRLVSSLEGVGGLARRALVEAVASILREKMGVDLGRVAPPRTPLEVIGDALSAAVERCEREGVKLVLVIDEAQNLITGLGLHVWSFVKLLATLQEQHPYSFRALLVTSDYGLYETLYREAPGVDYLDTFYLGEMTRVDARSLAEALNAREHDELLDVVGGHPALIQEVLASSSPRAAYRRRLRAYKRAVLEALAAARRGEARDVLMRLVEGPMPLEEAYSLPPEHHSLLKHLTRLNVLQLGCGEYLGVYEWNRECGEVDTRVEVEEGVGECGGGGPCGALDSIAPANRVALAALASLTGAAGPTWLREAIGRGIPGA